MIELTVKRSNLRPGAHPGFMLLSQISWSAVFRVSILSRAIFDGLLTATTNGSSVPSMSLNVLTIQRARELFDVKGWPINTGEFGEDEDRFSKFCELLELLNPQQKELIFQLSLEFSKINYNAYINHLLISYKSIPKEILNKADSIFCLPIIAPKDVGKIKSASGMPYPFTHMILKQDKSLKISNIDCVDSLNFLSNRYKNRKNSIIMAIDDFVGSGETASEFIDDYENNHRTDGDTLILVTIACLRAGLLAMNKRGYGLFFSVMQKRGISDSNSIANREFALAVMDEIESMISISSDYHHGYGQSEALIALTRTPNNTFPVYWASRRIGDGQWPGPFAR